MKKYKLLEKQTNSFGDLIVNLLDLTTRKTVTMSFEEGSWWQLDVILAEKRIN